MDEPQRLGKGMIYAAWILVLILLTLFFNYFLERQNNPNQEVMTQYNQDDYREVTLYRNRGGHYVATAAVNGQTVVVLVDTGATMVSIPEKVANRLNLRRGTPLLASTANGTVTTYATTLERIALGEIELQNILASINPQMQEEEILLGMSFLKQLDFSQRGNTLIIRQYLK